jgi:hypothetical protein
MTVMQHHPNPIPVPGIDCPKYQPRAGSKRCQHYLDGGACALASEFMCVEWLKRNGHAVPEHHPTRTVPPTQPALFPALVPANQDDVPTAPSTPEPTSRPSVAPMVPETMPAPVLAHPRAPITQDELDSFKALGVELCIRSEELGEVWLVPGYTGQARKEITPEHAATLRLLLEAFPGGRIAAFEKATVASRKEAQA